MTYRSLVTQNHNRFEALVNEDENHHSSQLTQNHSSCQNTNGQLAYESLDLIQGQGQGQQSNNTH